MNVCMVQLNFKFTDACRYMCVFAHLTHAKFQKLASALTVARNFGMHMWVALSLPHYMCGVTTGTVAVHNCFAADWLLYML